MMLILIHIDASRPWDGLLDLIADFADPRDHVRVELVDGQWAVRIGA